MGGKFPKILKDGITERRKIRRNPKRRKDGKSPAILTDRAIVIRPPVWRRLRIVKKGLGKVKKEQVCTPPRVK